MYIEEQDFAAPSNREDKEIHQQKIKRKKPDGSFQVFFGSVFYNRGVKLPWKEKNRRHRKHAHQKPVEAAFKSVKGIFLRKIGQFRSFFINIIKSVENPINNKNSQDDKENKFQETFNGNSGNNTESFFGRVNILSSVIRGKYCDDNNYVSCRIQKNII